MHSATVHLKSTSVTEAIMAALGAEGLAPYYPHPSLGKVCESFPSTDCSPSEFRDEYFRAEFCRKNASWDIDGVDREKAALDSFVEAEASCRKTNRKFSAWQISHSLDQRVLYKARRLIAGVLGPFNWDRVLSFCNFGPGASTSLPRKVAWPQNKWNPKRVSHGTQFVEPLYRTLRKWSSVNFNHRFAVVEGNTVTTVRKDALKDRLIAVEPDWNMFFQKGIGGLIRHCLQVRCGLLHPNAQEVHQELACIASMYGTLATLDLKSASDTVSLELCRALLPQDWFSALFRTRSPVGTISFGGVDETVEYEKISSMGNGYTFELETLLFWALTRATCGNAGEVSVYGDDIICPTDKAVPVMETLQACGFELNTRKSFWAGPFRESCGGHYFSGVDVTPVYLKPEDGVFDLLELIDLGNRLNQWATADSGFLDMRCYRVLEGIRAWVPQFLWGPYGCAGTLWTAGRGVKNLPNRWHKGFQAYKQKYIVRSEDRYQLSDDLGLGSLLSYLWTKPDTYCLADRFWPGADDLSVSFVTRVTGHRVRIKTRILDGWDDGHEG